MARKTLYGAVKTFDYGDIVYLLNEGIVNTNDLERVMEHLEIQDYEIYDYIQRCDECGEWEETDCMNWIESEEISVCDNCREKYFEECSDCGKLVRIDNIITKYNGYHICEECYSDCYCTCEECGEVYHLDDLSYDEEFYGYICEDCRESLEGLLSSNPNLKYYGEEKFIGIELEVDSSCYDNQRTSLCRSLKKEIGDRIFLKEDGSLSNRGVEIVSMPHSYEEIENLNLDRITEICYDHDYDYEPNGVGLHIHFDRKWLDSTKDTHIEKIAMLMTKFSKDVLNFSGREFEDLDHWARIPSIDNFYVSSSKYSCLNIRHSNTIEFRIFNSTLNSKKIKACIDFCISLIEYSRENDFKLDSIRDSFIDVALFKPTEELIWYLESLGYKKEGLTLDVA